MKTLNTPLALLAALALGGSGSVLAAEDMGSGAHRTDTMEATEAMGGEDAALFGGHFEDYDVDQDERISRSEAETNPDMMKRWSDIDTNQDDYLDSDEFSLFEEEMGGEMEMGEDGMEMETDE